MTTSSIPTRPSPDADPSRAGEQRAAYRLAHDPDGTSWTARENLTDILQRELVGPFDGPTELLPSSPDGRYLVGYLVPKALDDDPDQPLTDEDGAALPDTGDELDAREVPGVPLAADDETELGRDGDADDAPVRRGVMMAASMGLRCQVPLDLDAIDVRIAWGSYAPERAEETDDPTARPRRRYRRTPHEVRTSVRLAGLVAGETTSIVLKDDVTLRVDRFDDERDELGTPRMILELALCNDRATPRRIPMHLWLFQTEIEVSAGGRAVFLPAHDVLDDRTMPADAEEARLALQYRDLLEFAVGRTCSVGWDVETGARRATAVRTTWLPTTETPQTATRPIPGALTDMTLLATADKAALRAGLTPIIDEYAAWLDSESATAAALPEHLREVALEAIQDARLIEARLREGLDRLLDKPEALRCFHFMNAVMAQQRVHSQVVQARSQDPNLSMSAALARIADEGPKAHSWWPFQLAFILMQVPALIEPTTPRRSAPDQARAELIFFPTGGGKTEAYLGLAAYTFAVRRRKGIVDSDEGPLDGGDGVAVLMRYTLRLLTAQQFQRATTLVCAAELARRADPATWGSVPFRIGLWVGTDVSPKRVAEAAEEKKKLNDYGSGRFTALQIRRCPWCGSKVTPRDVTIDVTLGRVFVHCSDDLGDCPFGPGGAVDEGLPVLTVDEEIYRLVPAFLIATVDKFARLAREGAAAALFGRVSRRCDRHGYVHVDDTGCDVKAGSRHQAKGGLPAAGVRPVGRLRPPDLVIQDELHLITGALGTTVGLFEVAIDAMTRWQTPEGTPVRPLVIASSATVRNAADQVRCLYGRALTIFPPPVLDSGDSFFAYAVPVTPIDPGRRYIGVSATGVRLVNAEIRLSEILLAAGQLLLDHESDSAAIGSSRSDAKAAAADVVSRPAADPYLTLVGYFNTLRELAGMARYLVDDVHPALLRRGHAEELPRRRGTDFGELNTAELNARVSSVDITDTLDQHAVPFDPAYDTNAAQRAFATTPEADRPVRRKVNPFDVVLATSMLQVGVDVTRLGLMLIVGQPKNTAEYIQASSRVGRDPARPGLVVTLGNWTRPRDLAHFEAFRHYHETFYAQVEALSVTPFSLTSLERGLDGVLVSAARVLQAPLEGFGLSPEANAGLVGAHQSFLDALTDALVSRIALAGGEAAALNARNRLQARVALWAKRRADLIQQHLDLVYERSGSKGLVNRALMMSAETVDHRLDQPAPFVIANSMREVQPEINLLVSPAPDKLFRREPATAPAWAFPEEVS